MNTIEKQWPHGLRCIHCNIPIQQEGEPFVKVPSTTNRDVVEIMCVGCGTAREKVGQIQRSW